MARVGLDYAPTPYDTDRYERISRIAEGLAGLAMDAEFTPERPYLADLGYVTVKVGVGIAVLDPRGRVALIKRADNGRWALPGGFAEVGSSPSENALRELREESGLEARIDGLVGVYDNRRFNTSSAYHIYTCCFRATLTGGEPRPSNETLEVAFFETDALPGPMSGQQQRMILDAIAGAPAAVFQ